MKQKLIENLLSAIEKAQGEDGNRYTAHNPDCDEYEAGTWIYDCTVQIFVNSRNTAINRCNLYITIGCNNSDVIEMAHESRAEQANEIALCYPLTASPYSHTTISVPPYKSISKTFNMQMPTWCIDSEITIEWSKQAIEAVLEKWNEQPLTPQQEDFISLYETEKPLKTLKEEDEGEEIPF